MNILCVIPMSEKQRQAVVAAAGKEGNEFLFTSYDLVESEQVRNADIILGNVPAEMIGASPRLKLLQLNSAGADAYIREGVLSSETILCNATGAYNKSVAEHCFAMMLMLIKKLHLYRDNQNAELWNDEGGITSISDAVVLITGAGDIGSHFAGMCKSLGAYTIGVKRRPVSNIPEEFNEILLSDEVGEALPRADAVVNFLPGTPATNGLFNAAFFKKMKNSAVFINGGRGSSVVTDDLMKALDEGEIASAGLDVFEQEPLPTEHPLWKMKNVLITPHVAGGFHLAYTLDTIVDICVRNVDAVAHGRLPENIVDMETGYRA